MDNPQETLWFLS
ncbi:hypothetical protein RIR_e2281_jg10474.t1 [Rhizophagus irregularis DAOM 181602=DAOM 197198]|nr:hypothetical protein RIR_e2281_jg10474.t1 [Rhizophagus irregularis DAOM 181602=DAOM 197198]